MSVYQASEIKEKFKFLKCTSSAFNETWREQIFQFGDMENLNVLKQKKNNWYLCLLALGCSNTKASCSVVC